MNIQNTTLSTDRERIERATVFLRGIQRCVREVYLEIPSDIGEDEIMKFDRSVWEQVISPDAWELYEVSVGFFDGVGGEWSDDSEELRIDARIARTMDGQLVVLAK